MKSIQLDRETAERLVDAIAKRDLSEMPHELLDEVEDEIRYKFGTMPRKPSQMSDNEIRAILNVETALRRLEKVTPEPMLKQEATMIRESFQRRRVAMEHVHDLANRKEFAVGNE